MTNQPRIEPRIQPRIAIVGSINMDLVFRAPRMPAVGETLLGGEFHQIPGGKGANQAVAAARQGAEVAMIGCVGDDQFGGELLACLAADGVNLDGVARRAGVASGVAGIVVDGEGRNSIVVAPGANSALSVSQIDAAANLITSAKVLVCQLETPIAAVARAIVIARQSGARVIFNPSPMQTLDDELLRMVDYLIVNETEALQLSGIEVRDRADAELAAGKLLERSVGAVLLTMGEHGVLIADAGQVNYIPAVAVDAVDTTAAGDTFAGAFAVAIAQGKTLANAAALAQFAAALAVTKLGAQISIPHRQELRQFMIERGVAADLLDI